MDRICCWHVSYLRAFKDAAKNGTFHPTDHKSQCNCWRFFDGLHTKRPRPSIHLRCQLLSKLSKIKLAAASIGCSHLLFLGQRSGDDVVIHTPIGEPISLHPRPNFFVIKVNNCFKFWELCVFDLNLFLPVGDIGLVS